MGATQREWTQEEAREENPPLYADEGGAIPLYVFEQLLTQMQERLAESMTETMVKLQAQHARDLATMQSHYTREIAKLLAEMQAKPRAEGRLVQHDVAGTPPGAEKVAPTTKPATYASIAARLPPPPGD